jgi:hypothetical protein
VLNRLTIKDASVGVLDFPEPTQPPSPHYDAVFNLARYEGSCSWSLRVLSFALGMVAECMQLRVALTQFFNQAEVNSGNARHYP